MSLILAEKVGVIQILMAMLIMIQDNEDSDYPDYEGGDFLESDDGEDIIEEMTEDDIGNGANKF